MQSQGRQIYALLSFSTAQGEKNSNISMQACSKAHASATEQKMTHKEEIYMYIIFKNIKTLKHLCAHF